MELLKGELSIGPPFRWPQIPALPAELQANHRLLPSLESNETARE